MLELLPSAHPLKDRAPVHFHAGTAETVGEVRSLNAGKVIKPGSIAPVRIIFREPVLLVPGDRFIVRMFSPVVTIGGGEVVDAHGPARYRRNAGAARIEALARAPLAEYIATVVREAPYGTTLDQLVVRTGASADECEAALPASVVRLGTALVDARWVSETVRGWKDQLAVFHREQPLQPGIKREALRSRVLPQAPPALFDALLSTEPAILASGEILHLATHRLALKQDEEQALASIEGAFETAGLSVPGTAEVLSRAGVDPARARSLLQILLRQRRLVRVTDEMIFHPAALDRLRQILAPRKGERFSVPEFKEWTGISRKYAIPLLEYLDRERTTRREGDLRLIL
jgi:selenocysteine-specific elongation factor